MENYYPFNFKGAIAKDNKVILKTRMGHYCGYVQIPEALLPKHWIESQPIYRADNIELLNVHGGVTYSRKEGSMVVFGFDCAHSGDETNEKLKDEEYLFSLCEVMEQQILAHAKKIAKYQSYKSKEKRIKHIEAIRKTAKIGSEIAMIPLFCATMDK